MYIIITRWNKLDKLILEILDIVQYDFDSIFRYKILKYIYLCNSNFHSLSVSFCLIKITFRKIRIDRIVHDVTSNRGDHDSCTYKEKHSQCSLNSIYRVDLAWWNTQIMRIRADNRGCLWKKNIFWTNAAGTRYNLFCSPFSNSLFRFVEMFE